MSAWSWTKPGAAERPSGLQLAKLTVAGDRGREFGMSGSYNFTAAVQFEKNTCDITEVPERAVRFTAISNEIWDRIAGQGRAPESLAFPP